MMTNRSTVAPKLPFYRSMRGTLIILFLLVSLLPLIAVSSAIYYIAENALKKTTIAKLEAVRDIKAERIEQYFAERLGDVKVLSNNPSTIAAMHRFNDVLAKEMRTQKNDIVEVMQSYRSLYLGKNYIDTAADGSDYSFTHAKYHRIFREYLATYGYYDIFLVEPDNGVIIYSAFKEDDYGTSLIDGRYANTNISQAFKIARNEADPEFTVLVDYQHYQPSDEEAAFIASPIMTDETLIGVLVMQLSSDPINAVMEESRETIGKETGETIIISSDDFLLRSESHFIDNSVLQQKAETDASRASKQGETGVKENVMDYRGNNTLIAHKPLNIANVRWSLNAKVDTTEAFAEVSNMVFAISIVTVPSVIIVTIIAIWVSSTIATPIQTMTEVAQKLSLGDVDQTLAIKSKNEIGVMATMFQQMIDYQKNMARAATKLSQGDVTVNITPQSTQDVLGQAFQRMITYQRTMAVAANQLAVGDIRVDITPQSKDDLLGQAFAQMVGYQKNMATAANGVAQGDLTVTITPYSEEDVLGNAFQQMIIKLRQITAENEQRLWNSIGRSKLSEVMRGEQDVPTLAQQVIQFLCSYLSSPIGTLSIVEAEDTLHLVGTYAYFKRGNINNRFKIGEGLIGQAVLEKKPIMATNLPSDYITINSTLGQTNPANVLVIPFLYDNRVVGAIELGTLTEFNPKQVAFLEGIMENIAIAFHSAEARQRMQQLLEKTQQQAEELQVQQEELRVSNEELENQTNVLRISESKLRAQQTELETINTELEEKANTLQAQQQALDHQNQALKTAQTELEEKAEDLALASKYKSEFLANMSHELRTPLNSLLILARMLADNKEGNLNAEQVESAHIIYNGGNELLNLINDILDLSKVEAGKMEFHMAPVFLRDLVSMMQTQFMPVAEQKGVAFTLTLADDLPETIYSDQKRVAQIIKNFLSNAFKFTEQGEVELNLYQPDFSTNSSQNGFDAQPAIAIAVSDTGIGLTAEQKNIVFEAFQQADGSTTRLYGGTGLGLSISRELAYNLGGQIEIDSIYGEGSTFTLYLPLNGENSHQEIADKPQNGRQDRANNTQKVRQKEQYVTNSISTLSETKGQELKKRIRENDSEQESLPKIQPIAPKPVTIADDRDSLQPTDRSLLIIEDDVDFAKIVYNLSHKKGFRTLIATTGKTGLLLAEQYKPQAVILDLNLPDMSGWEVLAALKGNADLRHIPVHIMSVYDETLDAYKRGAIGYLTKPVTSNSLNKALAKVKTFVDQSTKRVLVVEDSVALRHSINKLLAGDGIEISEVGQGKAALELLRQQAFDCMVLDLSLPDMTGFQLLSTINQDATINSCPIIVYTGKELTREENAQLMKYADSVILKGVKSPERLLDETTLFLHQVVAELPLEQQNTIKQLYDKETVLVDKQILVVDDDVRNSFALSKLLADKGLKVMIAQNGQKALETLKETPTIDLILMDIMMPVMDGYETIQEIRKQSRFRTLPIIAVTAKAMKGDRDKCIAAGANDYLTKPIDANRLLSLLRVWLYGRT